MAEITKIQLKTKTSTNALSNIALTQGEPLVNTNDKTLIIGGKDNTSDSNADNSNNIILGASKNELAVDSNTLTLVHKDSNLVRSTHYIQLPQGQVKYDSSSATATLETAHSLAVDGNKVELKSADGTSQSSVTLDTHSYTPQGTVSKLTFSGTAASHKHKFTGGAHTHKFTGSAATSEPSDTTNKQVINALTSVGTLPSASLDQGSLPSATFNAGSHSFNTGSLPSLSVQCEKQCLTLTFNRGTLPSHEYSAPTHSFDAGALPSLTFNKGTLPETEKVTIPTTNHTHIVTATGELDAITVAGETENTSITPGGTISQPTFTGTESSITHEFKSNTEV